MGVVPSAVQASDHSIQFPVLPLVCKSIAETSLHRPHSISLDEAQHIQQSTVGKASNARWLELHACTITSLNFKKIISRQSAYTMEFFSSIFHQHDIGHVPAIHHGRVNESHAAQLYFEIKNDEGRPVVIQECGLCLHQEYRFLDPPPQTILCTITLQMTVLACCR